MYGFGKNNVPYMSSQFGHGSEKGGISNGITWRRRSSDGSGIDFKKKPKARMGGDRTMAAASAWFYGVTAL